MINFCNFLFTQFHKTILLNQAIDLKKSSYAILFMLQSLSLTTGTVVFCHSYESFLTILRQVQNNISKIEKCQLLQDFRLKAMSYYIPSPSSNTGNLFVSRFIGNFIHSCALKTSKSVGISTRSDGKRISLKKSFT